MAVSRLWAVRSRLSQVIDYATNPEKTDRELFTELDYQSLRDVLSYAKDESKTEQQFYCEGINCNVAIARSQFVTVKEQYAKTEGIQAYHGYLSFAEHEVSPDQCQRIGMEFAKRVWGKRFQVVVTTHLNTNHLHCHFVVNSVSFVDGKRINDREKYWKSFRHIVDEICKEHGLSTVNEPTYSKVNSYLKKQEESGAPTRYNLVREAIDYAISHSKSIVEFEYALKAMDYTYQLSSNRKYWTVIPKGYKKPIRLKTLGEAYTNERIIERLKENREKWNQIEPIPLKVYKPRQYRLQTREDKIKKKGGLYGLYLHYCYKLGYLPKYNQSKQKQRQLHYLLKEDLIKLDTITEEVRFLAGYQIDTVEELFLCKEKAISEIKILTEDRAHLQKKIRRKDVKQLSDLKMEIALIGEKISEFRREERLCQRILNRANVIEEKLDVIQAEEMRRTARGKERRRYE